MAYETIEAEDVLYGRNGKLTITYNNATQVIANVRNIEARVRVKSTEIMLAGSFADLHRRIGWGGEGTLRIYRVNKLFFETMKKMIDPTQTVPVFTLNMKLTNNDPDSDRKYQEDIAIGKVKIWDFDWMFDVTEFVDQPLRFTFEEITQPTVTSAAEQPVI